MGKNEAITMLLVDVCCSNGKDFCKVCPLNGEKGCKSFDYDEKQLLEAVKILSNLN